MEEKEGNQHLCVPRDPKDLVRLVRVQRVGEDHESESETEKECFPVVGVPDPGVLRRGRGRDR